MKTVHVCDFTPDLFGMLKCRSCSAIKAREFIAEPQDFERWSSHLRLMWDVLKDGGWHTREEIVKFGGAKPGAETKGFTGRITNLRTRGCLIVCDRLGSSGATRYRLMGVLKGSTTTLKGHCPCCTGHSEDGDE